MPSARALYWTGTCVSRRVSIGVELYAATASESTALHQIHKPSGKRVRYEKVVPGDRPLETSDIVKGFEIDDDPYVVWNRGAGRDQAGDSRAIELAQFVDRAEIDPRYFEKTLLCRAGRRCSRRRVHRHSRGAEPQPEKVGLGKLTMRGRKRPCRGHASAKGCSSRH